MLIAIVIAIAVVAVLVAGFAFKLLSNAKQKAVTDITALRAEIAAQSEQLTALSAQKTNLESELAARDQKAKEDAAKIAEQADKLAELQKAAEKAQREQTTSRQFFGRKARDTFEILKQRLVADGFPERIETLAAGFGNKNLSEEAKRLIKDVESWMEQGGLEDPNVLHTLAVLDYARGDAKRAELRLRTASRISADPLLWENLGDLMRLTGRAKRAVEAYRNAGKSAKDDSPVHRKLGLALFSASEYSGAVKPLTIALHNHPEDLDLYLKTARALTESGDFQKAVDLTHSGGKKFPRSPELPACAVVAFAKMKRFRDAESAFQAAVQIDAKSPDAYVARGFAYLEEGKPAEARKCFTTALECDPSRAEAFCGLGLAANRGGNFEDALQNLLRAVEIRSDYAEAWYAMKTTYEGLKKFESAVEALNKAVALNPHLRG